MKKYIFLTLLFSGFVNAQETIESLEDAQEMLPNHYYIDSENFLGPQAGTYLYQEGGRTFKIILSKKEHSSQNDIYFQDMLVGAYQYSDGNIQIDLLNDLDNDFACGCSHVLHFAYIKSGPAPGCWSCDSSQRWLVGRIYDPVSKSNDKIFLIPHLENGQAAIRVLINHEMRWNYGDNPSSPIHYPIGEELILIKQ